MVDIESTRSTPQPAYPMRAPHGPHPMGADGDVSVHLSEASKNRMMSSIAVDYKSAMDGKFSQEATTEFKGAFSKYGLKTAGEGGDRIAEVMPQLKRLSDTELNSLYEEVSKLDEKFGIYGVSKIRPDSSMYG